MTKENIRTLSLLVVAVLLGILPLVAGAQQEEADGEGLAIGTTEETESFTLDDLIDEVEPQTITIAESDPNFEAGAEFNAMPLLEVLDETNAIDENNNQIIFEQADGSTISITRNLFENDAYTPYLIYEGEGEAATYHLTWQATDGELPGDLSYPTDIQQVNVSFTAIQYILVLFDEFTIGSAIADWVDSFVDFLNQNVAWLFQALRWPIEQVILLMEDFLLWVPWPILLIGIGAIAYFTAGRDTAIISVVSMFVIGLFGLWDRTMTTTAMLLTSMLFCVIVGIPLGIWSARNDRVNDITRTVLDAMQTIHPFVYLVPIVVLFGIGKVPGTIATIIFALPPIVRLTDLGIRQVPGDVVEAAKAFGTTDRQLLFDVQLPLALPSIMAGLNQTLMLSLSMVVIVALIAGGGLGESIYVAIGSADTGRAAVAGVAVLLLAVVVDRISQGWTEVSRSDVD